MTGIELVGVLLPSPINVIKRAHVQILGLEFEWRPNHAVALSSPGSGDIVDGEVNPAPIAFVWHIEALKIGP